MITLSLSFLPGNFRDNTDLENKTKKAVSKKKSSFYRKNKTYSISVLWVRTEVVRPAFYFLVSLLLSPKSCFNPRLIFFITFFFQETTDRQN